MADASSDRTVLDDWVAKLAAELGIADLDLDITQVLDLAGSAAHAVVRPAAPLTTFVAGLAAGLAGGLPSDLQAAIDRANMVCEREDG
ncbi:MAG: molybdopterin-guanine dinucleotide biosynthesis protein [Aeromicrobium sp.]|nr:molybdopterin-guanine dinucleotide biosynthesis protein [Aeromicrobium sp.]